MTAAPRPSVDDPMGAFCPHGRVEIEGAASGPLQGLGVAVKDVFHVAGYPTGFGQPDWLRTHPPATETAAAVLRVLDAGARMVGKTITDELAYSLTGENIHYGTPVNPRDERRVPGGSSSGSAAAVAGGLADFALGTDCGGSVRLPASYCGILGFRPSHGRVSLAGVIPFAPSFDTVGWFARNADVLTRVGKVLLDAVGAAAAVRRLYVGEDAMALVEAPVRQALHRAVTLVESVLGPASGLTVAEAGVDSWMAVFRHVQAAEIWSNHGSWIESVRPRFGPGIRERLDWAATLTADDVAPYRRRHRSIRQEIAGRLGEGDILCLPTSPRIAPLKDTQTDIKETIYRNQALCLLCIAGLGGLPQVTLPLATLEGMPLGLSLVGAPGMDETLLAAARAVMVRAGAAANPGA